MIEAKRVMPEFLSDLEGIFKKHGVQMILQKNYHDAKLVLESTKDLSEMIIDYTDCESTITEKCLNSKSKRLKKHFGE